MSEIAFCKENTRRACLAIGVLAILIATPVLAGGFKTLMKAMKTTHQQAKALTSGVFSTQAAMAVLGAYSDQTREAVAQMSNSAEGQDMKKRFAAIDILIHKAQSTPSLDKAGFASVTAQIDAQCKSCHDAYN